MVEPTQAWTLPEREVVEIVIAAAKPIAPPIFWLVFRSPEAIPASLWPTPLSPPMDTETNDRASPVPVNRKGRRAMKTRISILTAVGSATRL